MARELTVLCGNHRFRARFWLPKSSLQSEARQSTGGVQILRMADQIRPAAQRADGTAVHKNWETIAEHSDARVPGGWRWVGIEEPVASALGGTHVILCHAVDDASQLRTRRDLLEDHQGQHRARERCWGHGIDDQVIARISVALAVRQQRGQ